MYVASSVSVTLKMQNKSELLLDSQHSVVRKESHDVQAACAASLTLSAVLSNALSVRARTHLHPLEKSPPLSFSPSEDTAALQTLDTKRPPPTCPSVPSAGREGRRNDNDKHQGNTADRERDYITRSLIIHRRVFKIWLVLN
ncbi:hypothetical protein E2C01_065313 [Portunus trituberculatus]|uniref:Uncharacterized protein n=1 Tax=Portunus trituberculatus TaxID=210409 RepID=A0A5B7HN22_PORTR|nr:hypothetical protein [Portunus trituberculatus]